MTREEVAQSVEEAIRRTRHEALTVGDVVCSRDSDLGLKILSIEDGIATVSDTHSEYLISIYELGHSEALRLSWLEKLYGDNLIVMSK